ncbi:hypothetical protein BH10PLA2_BH10PLA2_29900 [soil metagenome]
MRLHQVVLIASTLVGSWLGMQVVHECGHVLGAWGSGGVIERVVVHPLTISQTKLGDNPRPLVVVWAGPVLGVLMPLVAWWLVMFSRLSITFLVRFFAGFCLIANGAYLAIGSFDQIGDCGELLRVGSAVWQLWLFGFITVPAGFWLWHKQGAHFGFGPARGTVNVRIAYLTLAGVVSLVTLEVLLVRL